MQKYRNNQMETHLNREVTNQAEFLELAKELKDDIDSLYTSLRDTDDVDLRKQLREELTNAKTLQGGLLFLARRVSKYQQRFKHTFFKVSKQWVPQPLLQELIKESKRRLCTA